jgi:hypothetical protein
MKKNPAIAPAMLPNLQALARLSSQELRTLWPQWFDRPPPANIHRELLARTLAYRMQERTYGGLCAATRKNLRKLAEAVKANPTNDIIEAPRFTPGSRLIREWRGELHQVTVEAEGFVYRGKRYRSLSVIARNITGTQWSGPSFFGIKKPATGRRHPRHAA